MRIPYIVSNEPVSYMRYSVLYHVSKFILAYNCYKLNPLANLIFASGNMQSAFGGCAAAFLPELRRGYALCNVYDHMIFTSPAGKIREIS